MTNIQVLYKFIEHHTPHFYNEHGPRVYFCIHMSCIDCKVNKDCEEVTCGNTASISRSQLKKFKRKNIEHFI